MATLLQLRAEPWWGREVVTDELRWLGDQLCARTGRPRSAAGDKGNEVHLSGAHRSQEWLLHSRFSEDRDYTVQAGLTEAQARHIAAFDFTPGPWGTATNRRLVREMTTRLVTAGKAGGLDGLVEVIGTLDGRRVAGIRLPSGSTFHSDLSHLEHVHLTFSRRKLRDRTLMERILAVALGEADDMPTAGEFWAVKFRDYVTDAKGNRPTISASHALFSARADAYLARAEIVAVRTEVTALRELVAHAGGPDAVAILAGVDERLAAFRQQVRADVDEELDEQSRAGADTD